MEHIVGSETEKNILYTFACESMARTRYELYGNQAKLDGYLRAADFFLEAARQELQHGRRMYQALQGNPITGQWKIQQPLFGDTVSNLERSIESEHTEWEFVYPHFADIALQAGFPRLATVWRSIAVAEKYHEKRFRAMLQNVQAGNEIESFYQSLIRSAEKIRVLRCDSCGYVAEDGVVPDFCPVCGMGPEQFKPLGKT